MSSQDCTFDDDGFSQRLLRPWSFVSLGSSRFSISTHVPTLGEPSNISEENYTLPRRRHKTLGAWAQYSSTTRENPNPEEAIAVGEGGWWNQQMLVDRSLRSMAALTTIFAFIMIVICCTYMYDFTHRSNPHSTSVGSKEPGNCGSTEKWNVVCFSISNNFDSPINILLSTSSSTMPHLPVDSKLDVRKQVSSTWKAPSRQAFSRLQDMF